MNVSLPYTTTFGGLRENKSVQAFQTSLHQFTSSGCIQGLPGQGAKTACDVMRDQAFGLRLPLSISKSHKQFVVYRGIYRFYPSV